MICVLWLNIRSIAFTGSVRTLLRSTGLFGRLSLVAGAGNCSWRTFLSRLPPTHAYVRFCKLIAPPGTFWCIRGGMMVGMEARSTTLNTTADWLHAQVLLRRLTTSTGGNLSSQKFGSRARKYRGRWPVGGRLESLEAMTFFLMFRVFCMVLHVRQHTYA